MFVWARNASSVRAKVYAITKGMPSPRMTKEEFKQRFLNQFQDQSFDSLTAELERVAGGLDAYAHARKAPHTRRAGTGYADPDYDLALDWINAADAIRAESDAHNSSESADRILLINGSSRSEHTCPGEMSKSYRLAQVA
jgi:hypothetical protein